MTVGGTDHLDYDVDASDSDDPNYFDFEDNGWRIMNGVAWQMPLGRQGVGTLRLSHARSACAVDIRDSTFENRLVATNRSREDESTFEYEMTYDWPAVGQVAAGAQVRRYDVELDIAQPFGLENLFSTDRARVNAVDIESTFATHQPSAYVQLSRPLLGRLDATGGLRWDHYEYAERSTVDPRLGLVYHARPNLDVSVALGRYSQLPPLVFMNADPINRELVPIRAAHAVAGLAGQRRHGALLRDRDVRPEEAHPTVVRPGELRVVEGRAPRARRRVAARRLRHAARLLRHRRVQAGPPGAVGQAHLHVRAAGHAPASGVDGAEPAHPRPGAAQRGPRPRLPSPGCGVRTGASASGGETSWRFSSARTCTTAPTSAFSCGTRSGASGTSSPSCGA